MTGPPHAEQYGGSHGVRDQIGYYADLIEEATALWESLLQHHPFYTFLAINGAALTADSGATYDFISGLYEKGAFSFDNLVPWLRINVKLVSSRPSSREG